MSGHAKLDKRTQLTTLRTFSSSSEDKMLDRVRIEDIVIILMAYQLTRQWWLLNRRWVKGLWQWVNDHPQVTQLVHGAEPAAGCSCFHFRVRNTCRGVPVLLAVGAAWFGHDLARLLLAFYTNGLSRVVSSIVTQREPHDRQWLKNRKTTLKKFNHQLLYLRKVIAWKAFPLSV